MLEASQSKLISSPVFVLIVVWLLLLIMYLIRYSKGYRKSNLFNFDYDYRNATRKARKEKEQAPEGECTFLGVSENGRKVYLDNRAKHVFICGTTGSGKTVALSNFIKSGSDFDYPLLVVDGKGDIGSDSLLEVTKKLCPTRKTYVIDMNNPESSDKYNPFSNTSPDIIKDMVVNMTDWTEPHYKFNAERYIQKLCLLLSKAEVNISLGTLIRYLPGDSFLMLSKSLAEAEKISREEHLANMKLAKDSGQIAESAAARFATIQESAIGQIFDESGIDIYTALQENANIVFVLNPLLYPETAKLFGRLIIIDSKKAVSHFFTERKKRLFYLFDEINVYASSNLLDLINKSRSANITGILATQSLSDLDAVSETLKEQIIENCNNYIVLRQNSSTNAEQWANVLGTRKTMEATYQIRGSKGQVSQTDLGSLKKVREFLFHPDDIKTLQTGNAIFLSRDNMKHCKLKINKPF